MPETPKDPAKKKEVARVAPPLSDRVRRVKGGLNSVRTMVGDLESYWNIILKEKDDGADEVREEIETLLKLYGTR